MNANAKSNRYQWVKTLIIIGAIAGFIFAGGYVVYENWQLTSLASIEKYTEEQQRKAHLERLKTTKLHPEKIVDTAKAVPADISSTTSSINLETDKPPVSMIELPHAGKQLKNVTSHDVSWEWRVNAEETEQGRFAYEIVNGMIETARICKHYTFATDSYSHCRQAAKAWFKKQCAEGIKAACAAALMDE